MKTFNDDVMAIFLNMPVEKVKTMTHYQERSVTDRIVFAAKKNESGEWYDTTLVERAEQDVERAKKKLEKSVS